MITDINYLKNETDESLFIPKYIPKLIPEREKKKSDRKSEEKKVSNERKKLLTKLISVLRCIKYIKISDPMTLQIPIQQVILHLRTKEEMKLDILSFFILDSIERYKIDIESITKVTKLSSVIINEEINRLKKAELIKEDNGIITQTEMGKKLWYSNYISKIKEKNTIHQIQINLIEKSKVGEEVILNDKNKDAIQVIEKYKTDDFSLNDSFIKKYVKDYLSEDKEYNPDIIDSLYLEVNEKSKIQYVNKRISKLPCYRIIDENISQDSLIAEGIINSIVFEAVTNKYEIYYDTVSGDTFFNKPIIKRREPNLLLPQLHSITNEEEIIKSKIRKLFKLSSEEQLEMKSTKELKYYVDFHMVELYGDV